MYKYIYSCYTIIILPTVYFIILTVLMKVYILGSDNGRANAYIYYRRDCIAWCVGGIFQREINIPVVCGSHITT